MTKKMATFYVPGKGIDRVDDDGFYYPDSEYLAYCEFLDSWLNVTDGGVDDDMV